MISLDVGRMIRPPESAAGFQPPETHSVPTCSVGTVSSCHRLEVVELQERIRLLEAQRECDAATIRRLTGQVDTIRRDWCQLLVEFSAWAGRIAAPPADGPDA